jgi:hypothetical protein
MRLIPVLAALAALVPGAWSAAAAPPGGEPATVSLLPGWRQDDGSHMAALRVDLAPGWKTYWRAPGESGLAPRFDWGGSVNAAAVTPLWPRPRLFESDGVRTIGFSGGLVLPLRVTLADPAAPTVLSGLVSIGICREVCVPVEVTLGTVLPAAASPPDPAILAALADRPLTGAEAGVTGAWCRFEPAGAGGLTLRADIALPRDAPPRRAAAVEAGDAALWVSDARVHDIGGGAIAVTAGLGLPPATGGAPWIDRDALRITLIGDSDAVEIRGCAPP